MDELKFSDFEKVQKEIEANRKEKAKSLGLHSELWKNFSEREIAYMKAIIKATYKMVDAELIEPLEVYPMFKAITDIFETAHKKCEAEVKKHNKGEVQGGNSEG